MKKKIFALCLIVVLAAIAVVGGTLAYFTDTEDEINVFTLGNVKIDLVEEQRNKDGTELEEFVDNKVLVPVANPDDPIEWPKGEKVGGYTLPTVANFVDKIVTVDNEGSQDAYVRVLFAFPADMDDDKSADNMMMRWIYDVNEPAKTWTRTGGDVKVTLGGREYNVYNCTYIPVLNAKGAEGATTASPAITGVFINSHVDAIVDENGTISYLLKDADGNVVKGASYPKDDGPKMYVLTQGVQAAGFDDADTALTAGFGEVTAANAQAWFDVVATGDRADIN